MMALLPLTITAQNRKKKQKEEQQANIALEAALKKHISYLASDSLEGRRAGTKGEKLAAQYIISQYTQEGIEPGGTNGYLQEFTVDEGKSATTDTYLKINNRIAELQKDFFPLAYSANGNVNGNAAVALNQYAQPWFKDVKELLEDNQHNPHFDIDAAIKKETEKAASRGASALFLYNSSALTDNIQFNKNDHSASTPIPVVFITKRGYKTFFGNETIAQDILLQVSLHANVRQCSNVVAFMNNNAPSTIILGAHFDHLGYGEDKNALDTGHLVHNGADDNASGTAALIELARQLKRSTLKNNNYLIIHFSAEELGLLGSKYWLEHPTVQVNPNYMINMDMVGRYDSVHKLTVGGYGTSPYWGDLFAMNSPKDLAIKLDSSGSGPSDHEAFYRKDIPVLFFFTGSHPDYHKATDDWDKINYPGERAIIQFIYRLISVTDTKGKLVFTKTREQSMSRSTKFTVSLGVIPDYGFTGTGVRIDGVSGGKLAEKIGLQAGDILLQLGEYKFVDVMSYMETLAKFKKGDPAKLIIRRGNEEKEFNVVF